MSMDGVVVRYGQHRVASAGLESMDMSKEKPAARQKKADKPPTEPRTVSAARKPRTSARKRAAVGTDTRQRILNVASKEFSTKGYDGARVDDIVRLAKVSKNLIYHYFNSKEQLFITVLEAAYEGMHEYHRTWTIDAANATDGVRQLVRSTFEYWEKSSDFIGLLNSENLHRGKHLRKSKLTKDGYSGLLDKLSQLLKQGEKAGDFRPAVDAVELYISISALAYHYLSNRYTLAYLLGRKLSTEDDKNLRIAHIQDIILGYLHEGARRKK
jgi:TetR/AcrR family transcriptional regulator